MYMYMVLDLPTQSCTAVCMGSAVLLVHVDLDLYGYCSTCRTAVHAVYSTQLYLHVHVLDLAEVPTSTSRSLYSCRRTGHGCSGANY